MDRKLTLTPLYALVLLLVGVSAGPVGCARAKPPVSDYELLYQDNFEGNAVNEKDWRYRLDRRHGGYMDGLNLKENVSVSGGELHLAVRREKIAGKLENTGGGLISKHQFGYGYYETLSKPFMAGRGVHSAFWQAGGAVPNNNIFEIDSYEIDSKSSMGCNNLYIHIAPQGFEEVPWPCRAQVPFQFRPDGWFLDAYEYTPEGVIFYDNGHVVAKAQWPELTAAQAVWLTALNGCGKVDPDKLPGETTFKYFRYYARDYPGVNLLPNGNFEYNQDKINPEKPVCWQQDGTPGAGTVVRENACRDQYKLRHAKVDGPYEITTRQSLEFIRNGDYQLTAMVRSSGGQETARLLAFGFGGSEMAAEIPASAQWTKVIIPKIPVTNHGVTVAISSKAQAGQWLEIDDVQFLKPPLPGQPIAAPGPFVLVGDPIWSLARTEPITFAGDGKFYFFDRNVGFGDAITVAFVMNPDRRATMTPLARMPKTGTAGWAVQLTKAGEVTLQIGSAAKRCDITAGADYPQGRPTHVACVFDRGTARIFVNGVLSKEESGISFTTKDTTAPGRLGCVNDIYTAVEGVISVDEKKAKDASGLKAKTKYRGYVGTLGNVRIYNRALDAQEIQGLAADVKHETAEPQSTTNP